MDFSERMGLTSVRTAIQSDDMDGPLRNSLWNIFYPHVNEDFSANHPSLTAWYRLYRRIWTFELKNPSDECPFGYKAIQHLKGLILTAPWYQVYNYVEFVAQDPDFPSHLQNQFVANVNAVLEAELAGYRFVGDVLTPIISDVEIRAVEDALATGDQFKPVAVHLRSALELLSNREAPDYRNSIKESISAVEATCQIITGDANATLGVAIKKLEASGVSLHGAFKGALSQMYGYTSDAEGIRHALLDESSLEQADARFMLITCSAFVNYLKAKLAAQSKV